jgi:hypothetical protein
MMTMMMLIMMIIMMVTMMMMMTMMSPESLVRACPLTIWRVRAGGQGFAP